MLLVMSVRFGSALSIFDVIRVDTFTGTGASTCNVGATSTSRLEGLNLCMPSVASGASSMVVGTGALAYRLEYSDTMCGTATGNRTLIQVLLIIIPLSRSGARAASHASVVRFVGCVFERDSTGVSQCRTGVR
jgi:hypothetical protein